MDDVIGEVRRYVEQRIRWVTGANQEATTRALMAKLRRGVGKSPGSMPEIWETVFEDLPDGLMGYGKEPSRSEWAIHIALTLFALHQQGKNYKEVSQMMHKSGESLGTAMQKLIKSDEDRKRIKRRFDSVTTSQSVSEISYHLRNLVQMLRAENIALDYGLLAKDIYLFQFDNARDNVRLQWGRDFYRISRSDKNEEVKAKV